MAWIVMDLDKTLLQDGGMDPQSGQPLGDVPIDGSLEACMQLAAEGHRLTVYTSRFAPMPDSERQRLKEQVEQDLASYGFPPMEIWTGTTKPDADIFIGHNHVTYDGDWGLALAQTEMMLNDMGLTPQGMPNDASTGQPDESEMGGRMGELSSRGDNLDDASN